MNSNAADLHSSGLSRKRSFADITQSESPPTNPAPPFKRRRTSGNPHPSSSSSSSNPSLRFVGDGLDFRRPVMSGSGSTRFAEQITIDLTLDDDSPPPPPHPVSELPQQSSSRDQRSTQTNGRGQRAPPFSLPHAGYEVIDLSGIEDEDDTPPPNEWSETVTLSPELEFVGARVRTPPDPLPQRHASRRLPLPSTMPSLGDLADMIRGATQTMFGNIRYDRDYLNLAGLGVRTHGGQRVTYDPAANLAIYEDVELDYGLAGFALGIPEEPPANPPDRSYKAPNAARDGFTRTYDEDDILVCGLCGDELAASDDEVKAQVWIVKACGHAYCGTCAHNRSTGRGKKTGIKKPAGFRVCAIPGCDKTVDSKTKMFQIYL